MVSYKQIADLESQDKIFYDSKDISVFLNLTGRTLENTIKRLLDESVLIFLEKSKYYVASKQPNEMQIAHFLYNPSYISFETALSYYGVLSQFPNAVTSVTTKRTKSKIISGKEYIYSHINKKYFKGYKKENDFLIATAEKALVDQIYFSFKSLKSLKNLDEYDTSSIDKNRALNYSGLVEGALGKKITRLLKDNL